MWYFELVEGDAVWYPKKSENSAGRGSADLVLSGDKSVSRLHARLFVSADGGLSLRDESSRYGTFVSRDAAEAPVKVDPSDSFPLGPDDVVHFGLLHNRWRVRKFEATVCFSTVEPRRFLPLMDSLRVRVSDEWTPECTHLTMPSVTLTHKAVSALVHIKPIVTPDFWEECRKSRDGDRPLPDPSHFLPTLDESALNRHSADLRVNEARGSLFAGREFVFLSRRQKERYRPIVEAARGVCALLGERKLTKSQICAPERVVVRPPVDQTSQDTVSGRTAAVDVVDLLRSRDLRAVPEGEIGLAVLYASLTKYCNPNFNVASEMIRAPSPEDAPQTILAHETQDPTRSSGRKSKNVVIDESASETSGKTRISLDSSRLTLSGIGKSKRSPSDSDGPAPKRSVVSTPSNFKTPRVETACDSLFDFVSDDTAKDGVRQRSDIGSRVLNIKRKITKKKAREDEPADDLFNFVPENPVRDIMESRRSSGSSADGTGFNFKRPRLNLKSPREKSPSVDRSVNIKPTFLNASSESMRWISRAEPSENVVVKKENHTADDVDAGPDDSLEAKLEKMRLRLAVVIVNEGLVKKVVDRSTIPQGIRPNFKRFVKVRSAKSPPEVITRSMLDVYSREDGNLRDSISASERNDNDDVQFDILNSRGGNRNKRTRRL